MRKIGLIAVLVSALLLPAAPFVAWAAHAAPHGTEAYPDQLDADLQTTTAHEVEGKAGLPQFDPSTFSSQIFWLAVTFAVLYVFFSKMALPGIGAVLQTREKHIQDNLDAAQNLKEKAESARQSYEAALKDSQEKSAALFAKIDSDIKQETVRRLQAFQDRAADEVTGAESLIEKAKKEAMENIQGIAAEIASLAAEKIVGIAADIDQAKTAVKKIKKAA